MSKKNKAAIQLVVLSIICSLIIWHAVTWHSTGMYLEMYSWIGGNKAYITVLYNLGVMLVLGALLGLLMEKLTDLFGYEVHEIKHFKDDTEFGDKG